MTSALFNAEARYKGNYNRIMLSPVLSGGKGPIQTSVTHDDVMVGGGTMTSTALWRNSGWCAIDRAAKTVTRRETAVAYDKLVSRPQGREPLYDNLCQATIGASSLSRI